MMQTIQLCDGCNVREPFEHRCHGKPCRCEECRMGDLFMHLSGHHDYHLSLNDMAEAELYAVEELHNGLHSRGYAHHGYSWTEA